jgi:hypothetical protein
MQFCQKTVHKAVGITRVDSLFGVWLELLIVFNSCDREVLKAAWSGASMIPVHGLLVQETQC